jgi:hypothetical protein
MAARIRSLRNGIAPIDEASRDDLVVGDIVTLSSLDAATTYNWAIVFAPRDLANIPSTATFSGSSGAVSPGSFTVDHEGAYLIRLVVDAGLPTEDTQYVRLRALTSSLGLTLVSAGERRDGTGTIPVDVDIEGWANEQNFNLLALENFATSLSLSAVLAIGNQTGGTDILVTTGDSIVGQTDLSLTSGGASSDILLTPGASGAVVVSGKLTVTGLIDPTGLVLTEQASDPAGTGPGEGTLWVRGDTPNTPMFTDGAGTDWEISRTSTSSPGVPSGTPLVYHLNLPDNPNDLLEYRGWVPYACTLLSVRTYMGTLNNQGNYTLDVKKGSVGGPSVLFGGTPFDMNTLVADTVTGVPLKAPGDPDLAFSASGRWTIVLISDDIAFNGQDIYVELVFGVV